ncbi:Srd anti-sigma factor [Vibrio phage D479]
MKYPLEVNQKYDALRRSARKRGLVFNLRKKDVAILIAETKCAYSGETFGEGQQECMTVERINPYEGYIRGNCIVIKKKYNDVRSDDVTVEQSEDRMNQAKKKLKEQKNTLTQMQTEQAAEEKRMRKLNTELNRLKNSTNTRKQKIGNLNARIANTENFVANMTIMIEGVRRVYAERSKSIFTRLKEKLKWT